MSPWIVFVARRFLRSARVSAGGAGRLAVLGIAAGVATLIVVLGVMNGFQLGQIESILEVNSFHLRIDSGVALSDAERISDRIAELSAVPGVEAALPTAEFQTMARGFWPEPQGIVIRVVPENWFVLDPSAADQVEVVSGAFDLSSPAGIVLGIELARVLGVRVGDHVAVTHIPAGGNRPAEEELVVSGLFRTGYLDFDRNWGFVSIAGAVETLAARDTIVVGMKLENRFHDRRAVEVVEPIIPETWRIESWREFNRGIFGALRVEKAMMTFLIALIFVVVAGNIYQLLRRSILERSEEIAILRALGAGPDNLRRVFALEGWLIGVGGTLAGVVIGLVLAINVNAIFASLEALTLFLGDYGVRVFSPTYFYIEEIPVRILGSEVVLVGAGAIGVSVAAARLAGRSVLHHVPMELLRGE